MWQKLEWPRPRLEARLTSTEAAALLGEFGMIADDHSAPVALTVGSNSRLWRVATRHGLQLLLRLTEPDVPRAELEAMADLATEVAAGGIVTRIPLRRANADTTVCDERGAWQCWHWIPGRESTSDAVDLTALGNVLAKLHTLFSGESFAGTSIRPRYWTGLQLSDDEQRASFQRALASTDVDSPESIADRILAVAHGSQGDDAAPSHGDCHLQNFLILPSGEVAVFDLEVVGRYPDGRAADLGNLLHRCARLSAAHTADMGATFAAVDCVAEAYSPGGRAVVEPALRAALRESIAKVIGGIDYALPRWLDEQGRRQIASNQLIFACELTMLIAGVRR